MLDKNNDERVKSDRLPVALAAFAYGLGVTLSKQIDEDDDMTSTHPDNPEAAHYFNVTRRLEEENQKLKERLERWNKPLTPEEFSELRKLNHYEFTKYLRKRAGLDET